MQTVARKSATKQAAQARRLLAAVKPAQYVLDATIQVDRLAGRDVVLCRAHADITIGALAIAKGENYYLISSNVGINRFYAARHTQEEFKASSNDKATINLLARRVHQYRTRLFGGSQAAA